MADFRFYCLDTANHILHGADLDAGDLHAAIQLAYAACGEHQAPPGRIEIWQSTNRLYVTD